MYCLYWLKNADRFRVCSYARVIPALLIEVESSG
jgi:hypothetical protein